MSLLKRIVQSTPIPISDVMFSFSALDTLFQSLQRIFRRSLEAGCMLCREGGGHTAPKPLQEVAYGMTGSLHKKDT